MDCCRDHILPWLTHLTMRQHVFVPYRARTIAQASGRVLEIGIGSGLNLPYYGSTVKGIVGLDPSPKLLQYAREVRSRLSIPLQLVQGDAERMPIESASIDTATTTWTMCSISDLLTALTDIRRVLKPAGRLLFVEHGRAPDADVQWWQDRLTPSWKRLSGGCHLNRAIEDIVRSAGFCVDRIEKGYMKGPRPMTFMYEGQARPR
jgi:ubiquinone/menaquinone biosynthesis C-methylase UbiE